jgi:HEAT repeat protein
VAKRRSLVVPLMLGGGAAVLGLLICGGCVGGAFFLFPRTSGHPEEAAGHGNGVRVAQDAEPPVPAVPDRPKPDAGNPNPRADGPKPDPGNKPDPRPNPPKDKPDGPEPDARAGGPGTLDWAVVWLRGNQLQQLRAIEFLEKAEVDPKRQAEVAGELEKLLNGNDRLVAKESTKALTVWATREQVPSLLKALDDPNVYVRRGAVQALGPLKDERAVVPVAKFLTKFGDREVAGRSLIAMGPMVEPEVRKYLEDPEQATRDEASRVLRQIGKADAAKDAFEANLAGLKDPNFASRRKAAEYFAAAKPDHPRRAEVAAELTRLVKDDQASRPAAAKALLVWVTKDQVPDLIDALQKLKNDISTPPLIMQMLGKLQDERAIAPVAEFLPDHFKNQAAVDALIAMGPMVEDEVLKYLDDEHWEAREGACKVLKKVGTKKSLPALRKAAARAQQEMYGGWRQVYDAGTAAVTAIQARAK